MRVWLTVLVVGGLLGCGGEDVELRRAVIEDGFCGAPCSFTLVFDGDSVASSVRLVDEVPELAKSGELTDRGSDVLDAALASIEGRELEPSYGCPNCVDQGAVDVELRMLGETRTVRYEALDPPELLADLTTLVLNLRRAFDVCGDEFGELVEVEAPCTALSF